MNVLMKIAVVSAAGMVAVWWALGFILWDWAVADWPGEWRFVLVFVGFLVSCFLIWFSMEAQFGDNDD